MNRTKFWEIFIFVLVLAGFGLGMLQLFWQGSSTGESYPPYSTLRADPLGSKVLFDALGHTKGRRVARIFDDLARLPPGQSTSLILAGASTSADPRSLLEAIERFCSEGGRLIIAFFPETAGSTASGCAKTASSTEATEEETAASAEAAEAETAESNENENEAMDLISIEERWNFRYHRLDAVTLKKPGLIAQRLVEATELPDHFSWHSALTFEPTGSEWQTLYRVNGQAALIQRPWGRGEIILLGDAFLLSNEAMLRERRPALLSWLLGNSGTLLFDETHLGLRRSSSVMVLIHQFGLTPLLLLLLLLGGLFAWKNSQSLITPPVALKPGRPAASGFDASAGLVSLLRRGVPAQDLLKVCLEEWQRLGRFDTPRLRGQKEQLAKIVAEEQTRPAGKRNNVQAYNQMVAVINERK
jgi:hypothetical protein